MQRTWTVFKDLKVGERFRFTFGQDRRPGLTVFKKVSSRRFALADGPAGSKLTTGALTSVIAIEGSEQ